MCGVVCFIHEAIIEKEKKNFGCYFLQFILQKMKEFQLCGALVKSQSQNGKGCLSMYFEIMKGLVLSRGEISLPFPLRSVLIFIYFLQFFLYLFMLNVLLINQFQFTYHISISIIFVPNNSNN